MSLAVAIQMDPIEGVNIDADSTFVLALEAQRRGHALYHYLPKNLTFRHGRLYARARPLTVRRVKGDHASLGAFEMLDLATMDVVLMRQDPPFDMAYITATHLLEHIHPRTLVVNDPIHVRNAPEKLYATHFASLMPPTIITSDREEIVAFRAEHKDIIVKPLFGSMGLGMVRVSDEDVAFRVFRALEAIRGVYYIQRAILNALLEMFTSLYREPIIVQRYLPEIREGDKRIILIDGEASGAVVRIPRTGEARANFHAGGAARKSDLTHRDLEICHAIGASLRERGLLFVGIDVIGGFLTEINVTSPTGVQEINRLNGVALETRIWDSIERAFAKGRQGRHV